MTKLREPGGFGHAMTIIAARLGWDGAAEVVGKEERTVRFWSEDESPLLPTVAQAFALDAAFLKAGGGEPPLLAAYARMLDRVVPMPGEEADRLEAAAKAAKEAGEFTAAVFRAVAPGADHRATAEVVREGQEAIEAISDVVHRLKPAARIS